MSNNIMVIRESKVYEFSTLKSLLDWTVLELIGQPKGEVLPKSEVKIEDKADPISKKGQEALDKILSEKPEIKGKDFNTPWGGNINKGESKSAPKPPNSFDLEPMRKAYFPKKEGQADQLNTFAYLVDGQRPSKSPANVCRHLFIKTEAYANLPERDQRIAREWGLTLLKKAVRASGGKTQSLTTKVLESCSYDKFSYMAGSKITFTVSIKE
jgi:hypothetical protein